MALLTERQRAAFLGRKRAKWSLYILLAMLLASSASELVANSKPLWMKWQGKHYFPIFRAPSNVELGVQSTYLEANFRELAPQMEAALWPPLRYDPYMTDASLDKYPAPPDSQHPMGTDDRGRDVAARLLYGLRNSLIFALSVWAISYALGFIFGAVQGYFGGRIDFVFQRLIEVYSAIPSFFLLIILVSMLKPSMPLFIVLTAAFGWIGISYYVRADFFRLRNLDFVQAARSLGVSRLRLVFRHFLPNALTPIITFTPFALTSNITALAGLDFLGFGLNAPAASWGELLNQAKTHFDYAWWLAVYPSAALALTLLLLNFVGEGLREALDPRST